MGCRHSCPWIEAKRLRDALDAAIRLAEQTETSENNPPAALYGNIE